MTAMITAIAMGMRIRSATAKPATTGQVVDIGISGAGGVGGGASASPG